MKASSLFFILLLVYTTTSSLTCCKPTADQKFDTSRSWVPLKGKTALTFLDENGMAFTFPLHVIDSIVATYSKCSDYTIEYIHATLYLNPSKTDSIHLYMSAPNFLMVKASSNNQPNIDVGGIIFETRQGLIEQRSNFILGNRSYAEVRLTLPWQGYRRTIDSLYVANNYGLIGFKYFNKKYTLQ